MKSYLPTWFSVRLMLARYRRRRLKRALRVLLTSYPATGLLSPVDEKRLMLSLAQALSTDIVGIEYNRMADPWLPQIILHLSSTTTAPSLTSNAILGAHSILSQNQSSPK